MNEYVSKERRRLEKELLMYLRKYRFYSARFKKNWRLKRNYSSDCKRIKKRYL